MLRTLAAAGVTAVLFTGASPAWADEDLFRSSNCLACHHWEQRRIGPNLKAVAAKYADDPTAADRLARVILNGGVGSWGQLPMPPQTQVSEEAARQLAAYILSLR